MKKSGEIKNAHGGKRPKTTRMNVVPSAPAPEAAADPAPAPPAPPAAPAPGMLDENRAREAAEKLAAELHLVVQDLTEKAAGLEQKVAKLTEEAAAARREADEAKAKASRLEADQAKAPPPQPPTAADETKVRKLKTDLNTATGEINRLMGSNSALSQRLEEAARALEAAKKPEDAEQKEKVQAELAASKAQVAQLTKDLADGRKEFEEVRKTVEQKDKLQAELAAAKSQVAQLTKDHADGRKELEEVRKTAEQKDKLQPELAASKAEAAGLRKDLDGVRKEFDSFRNTADHHRMDQVKLRAEILELSRARDVAKEENGRLSVQISNFSKELEKLRLEGQAAAKARDAAKEDVARLTKQLDEAKRASAEDAERVKLAKQLDEARKELETQRSWNSAKEGQERLLLAQLKEAQKAKEELGPLKTRVEAFTELLKSTDQQIADGHHRIEELEAELARMMESEAEAKKQATEAAGKGTAELRRLEDVTKALELQIAGQKSSIAELERRVAGEAARAATFEAEAKKQAAESASSRKAAESRATEIRRLEAVKKAQDDQIAGLQKSNAELERRLDAVRSVFSALPAAPAPVAPPPVVKAEEPPPPPAPEPEPDLPPAPVEEKVEIDIELPPAPPPPAPVAPPAPAPVAPPASKGTTAMRKKRIDPAEAALEPRNLFGPAADDGKPAYVLLEMLYGDTLGAVYRAAERIPNREFAVRFMAGQAGEEQTAVIAKEVELLIALPHPNILHVQGSGRRQSRLYIAMDYVDAPTLGRAGIQEIPRLAAIFREVAEAVHYAHVEGILHGDLNPENILIGRVDDHDHPFVKDFGLAHLLEGVGSSAKEPGPILRMPAYQAPEQKRSIAADVYSLGATFYGVLAGKPPFEGQDAKQILMRSRIGEPPPLERLRKDVPESLGTVIRRAMAKEPSVRYATAKDMAVALKRVQEGAVTTIRPRPTLPSL